MAMKTLNIRNGELCQSTMYSVDNHWVSLDQNDDGKLVRCPVRACYHHMWLQLNPETRHSLVLEFQMIRKLCPRRCGLLKVHMNSGRVYRLNFTSWPALKKFLAECFRDGFIVPSSKRIKLPKLLKKPSFTAGHWSESAVKLANLALERLDGYEPYYLPNIPVNILGNGQGNHYPANDNIVSRL